MVTLAIALLLLQILFRLAIPSLALLTSPLAAVVANAFSKNEFIVAFLQPLCYNITYSRTEKNHEEICLNY